MIDLRFVQMMYQQWIQGNEEYTHAWREFIELAARQTHHTQEELLKELKNTNWFKWYEK